jgi:hypothetical protein
MSNLCGQDFCDRVISSKLCKTLVDYGFVFENDVMLYDKDFGDGVVEYFDCGSLKFLKDNITVDVYQSRFSDSFAIEVNRSRIFGESLFTIGMIDDGKLINQVQSWLQTYL